MSCKQTLSRRKRLGIVSAYCRFSRFFKLSLRTEIINSRLFMKIKSVILVIASCALLLGCKDDKPQYGAPMTSLKVVGVNGVPDLAEGLKMGVFVSDPVGVSNQSATVSANGALVLDDEVKWGFDQTQSSRFFAYAPYDESFTGQETVEFKAPADQSTAEKMLQGNLLTAIASGSPNEASVMLKLKHAMTAMTVAFDNRTGQKIESMLVTGFMTEGKLNLITGALTATGGKKVITPLRAPGDDNSFSFIYIPQDVTPLFTVTLSSGKRMTFTYKDNYCHEYPEKIIRMNIQIDESTLEGNILEMDGVNMTQWTTNGIPAFDVAPSFINLAGLRYVEPDKDGFFSAYINKATVTAVDDTDPEVQGVILEDSTAAIHVWAYYNDRFEVGNTVAGPILGLMDKRKNNEYHISYFYTKYATIAKTDVLPCTEVSISDLEKNIVKMEYRRTKLKDVTVKQPFDGDRAVFIQGEDEISVVCQDIEVALAEGAKGDIIGFPINNGTDIIFRVYDQAQFSSFKKEEAVIPFTEDSIYGLYDFTEPDVAVYAMNGQDAELQYSIRTFEYGRTLQVADTHSGEVHLFLVYDTSAPVVGHEYVVAFNPLGKSDRKGTTTMMECVKVNDNTAWLIDQSGKFGLVLAL